MSSPSSVRTFSLGDAGEVVVAVHPEGLRLESVTPAMGWQVGHRFPDGLFAKRRPADAVGVTLRNGDARHTTAEAELEIGKLDDGRWEIAQRRSHNATRWDEVDVRCGSIGLDWNGIALTMSGPEAAPGWRIQQVDGPTGEDGSWELVVIWGRGDEDIELMVHCSAGEDPSGYALVDIDERQRVAAL